MKIFITGAAGFIGSQLAYKMLKSAHEVLLLDNFSYGHEDNLIFPDYDFRSEIIRGDIRDTDLIRKLFKEHNFDCVCHIAAITPLPDCQMNPAQAADVNVTGTVNLLEASRIYGVKKFLFASTSAVYENNTDFPSVESNVIPPSLVYPSTKYAAEQFCRSYADVYGMDTVCLRFANVYGPHLDCLRTQPPVLGYLIRELFHGRSPVLHGTGEQRRDFVYVGDLTDLTESVLKANGCDTVNVSSGKTYSINELMTLTARLMGSAIKPVYREAAHFWHSYPELYQGSYPISEDALNGEVTKFTCLSNSHAFEKYGWKPQTDLETGVKNTIEFSVRILNSTKDRDNVKILEQ
ncbi:MAG: NAD-dependent epimerase/dehydratase family protein [Oscillospiraceae bacterium]|jgi:UDP-glucose 4-epimerase|nr:NAD-dependent epimerase/dehydratase family protein [Oscillospiraceae bacterium]